jgi:hypothetical protein
MIFRSENYIEGGGYMVFFEKIFVADLNQIAVSYCIGSVEFRYSKSSVPLNPFFAVGAKNMDFLVFCDFLKNEKIQVNFFSTQKKRLDKGNPTVQNSLPYVA